MIVAIVGSRDGVNLDTVHSYVQALHEKHPTFSLISGGARGVDSCAELSAWTLDHEVVSLRPVEIRPDLFQIQQWIAPPGPGEMWHNTTADYGDYRTFRDAAMARNTFIAKECDVLVAFTAGSHGTANAITEARRFGKPFHVYGPQGTPL